MYFELNYVEKLSDIFNLKPAADLKTAFNEPY